MVNRDKCITVKAIADQLDALRSAVHRILTGEFAMSKITSAITHQQRK